MWATEQIGRVESAVPQAPSAAITSCTSVNLEENSKIYTYTPNSGNGPCNNFGNSVTSNQVTLSCSTGNRFRNHWVKKVSVAGLNKLNVKANLTIDDHGFFTDSPSGVGVKYDDYSSLTVLSKDPTPTFDSECNVICSDADWPKCGIAAADSSILGKCGVAKWTTSKACDFDVNVSGLDYVYMVFHTSNPWPARITGGMSQMEVYPSN